MPASSLRGHSVWGIAPGPSTCLDLCPPLPCLATWGQDSSSTWVRRAQVPTPAPAPYPSLGLCLGSWAHAIVCAQVGWHGNSEQEADCSLIAICQAECQDRDGKKTQHQKKEVLASACCGLSHSLRPSSAAHCREKANPKRRWRPGFEGQSGLSHQPGEGRAQWRMESLLGPRPPSTRCGWLGPGC